MSATLRLFGKLSNTNDPSIVARLHGVSNTSWSETGLTWNNKPASGAALGDVTVIGTSGQWYEWDVSEYLRQQKLAGATAVSFAIKGVNSSDPWLGFDADEGSNRPELLVMHTPAEEEPPPPPPPPPQNQEYRAAADAYVRDGSSNVNVNFGAAAQLAVKKDSTGYNREAYLRFDLTGAPVTISSAKLRLFGAAGGSKPGSIGVYTATDTSWGESAITWNTRPATSAAPLSTVTVAGGAAAWYEWDVTAFLQAERAAGRTLVTLVLKGVTTTPDTILFNSDEAATNHPLLTSA